MRRLPPLRNPGRRALKRIAVVVGVLFVLVGIAAIVGDAGEAQPGRRTALYVRALRNLREAFGDPGGGIAMILIGLLLGGGMYWLASRRD